MKTYFTLLALFAVGLAHAEVLTPKEANAICRAKALRAAHFIMESDKPFYVSYQASKVAEISTGIVYEFKYAGIEDAVVTVQAFAYPDNQYCLIGQITNNLAGND